MFWKSRKRRGRITIEEQLRILADCGIAMRHDRNIDELLISGSREEFEVEPFHHLLVALGHEVEEEPWGRWFSDNVSHLDTECIDDHGSYVRIAERMRALAQGKLPIAVIEDSINLGDGQGEGRAWLSFELDGQHVT